MPWFRVDDTLAFHHKTVMAGNAAMGLWVRAGSWSMHTLSDGFIPDAIATQLGSRRQVKRLVTTGLWIAVEGGYQMWREDFRPIWTGVVGDYRPAIPASLRGEVYARDGFACRHCGSTKNLSLDHIYPYSLGGEDTFDNLQTLCQPCNSRKGARI